MIRPAKVQDLPAILALEASAFETPWSRQSLEEELLLGEDWPRLYVAEDTEIVAYCACVRLLGELEIYRIAVDPKRRREGWGRALVSYVLEQSGTKLCRLEVRAGNLGARAFYEQLGFRPVGLRKNYYTDSGEDAILLNRVGNEDEKDDNE